MAFTTARSQIMHAWLNIVLRQNKRDEGYMLHLNRKRPCLRSRSRAALQSTDLGAHLIQRFANSSFRIFQGIWLSTVTLMHPVQHKRKTKGRRKSKETNTKPARTQPNSLRFLWPTRKEHQMGHATSMKGAPREHPARCCSLCSQANWHSMKQIPSSRNKP